MTTLFLDRDGVVNYRTPGEYVRYPDDFHFLPGSIEAMVNLRNTFDHLIVVTNQKGVGKGLMDLNDLNEVHQKMENELLDYGVEIDGVYVATSARLTSTSRHKPNPAMGLEARQDFPNINFNQSVMVGDSASDMAFGACLGMTTVLVEGKFEDRLALANMQIDHRCRDLLAFAKWWCKY